MGGWPSEVQPLGRVRPLQLPHADGVLLVRAVGDSDDATDNNRIGYPGPRAKENTGRDAECSESDVSAPESDDQAGR